MLNGFDFKMPEIQHQLTDTIAVLKNYNGLDIPPRYFTAAMERLRGKFLNPQRPAVHHYLERVVAAVNAATPGSYAEVDIPYE